jgi:hypothetical protein
VGFIYPGGEADPKNIKFDPKLSLIMLGNSLDS